MTPRAHQLVDELEQAFAAGDLDRAAALAEAAAAELRAVRPATHGHELWTQRLDVIARRLDAMADSLAARLEPSQ